jgi:hypothetical protein
MTEHGGAQWHDADTLRHHSVTSRQGFHTVSSVQPRLSNSIALSDASAAEEIVELRWFEDVVDSMGVLAHDGGSDAGRDACGGGGAVQSVPACRG